MDPSPDTVEGRYQGWYAANHIERSEPFTKLLSEFFEAATELDKIVKDAHARGHIHNADLYPAMQKRDAAGKALHDYICTVVVMAQQLSG